MTEEQIVKQNEKFAQFMGYEGQHEDWCGNHILVEDMFSEDGKSLVPYEVHKNWHYIMEIVIELNKWEGVEITIKGDECTFKYGSKVKARHAYFDNLIRSVYDVITVAVDFIQEKTQVKI
jgi:hypothetical protein